MRSRLLAASVTASLALTLAPAVANAEPAPLTGVELNKNVSQSVAVDATFDYAAARNIGLPALKQLRGEMWDRNPLFNNSNTRATTRLQDVARQNGLDTKQKYVDAVAIDDGLTRIAIQRAAEQGALWGHTRPDGTDAFTAKVNGRQSWGESLGAGTKLRESILQSWGRGELEKLNANGGAFSGGGGHLHMMINPVNRYYGFGEVAIPGTEYGTYTAASTSTTSGTSTPMQSGRQRVWLYRAPKAGEAPTGIKQGTPGSASQSTPSQNTPSQNTPGRVDQNPGAGTGTGTVTNVDINAVIGIIFGVLSLLGIIAGIAKQFGLLG